MSISLRSGSAFALATLVAVGCGDKKPPENPQGQYAGYPQQQGMAPQGQYPQQGQPQPYPQQGQPQPYPQQGQPQPYPQQGQPQPTGQQPQQPTGAQPQQPTNIGGIPIDPNLMSQIAAAGAAIMTPGGVTGDPVEAAIRAEGARSAPGMSPEGQMAKDQLPADGHKEMLITMQGGKCYTIIGFSPAGQIKDLDLRLLAPPLYNMMAGQDGTASNTAIIGKGSNPTCPLTPFPLQYKLDIHAKNGAGAFGVQVFSKNK